jgi:hypothetical protein
LAAASFIKRDTHGDGDLWDYCVDDPINCVDPWGLKTYSACVGGDVDILGHRVGGDVCVNIDSSSDVGMSATVRQGAATNTGASAGVGVGYTDAHSIDQLAGKNTYIQATVGPASIKHVQGDGYTGNQVGVGTSTPFSMPVQVSAGEEYTVMLPRDKTPLAEQID